MKHGKFALSLSRRISAALLAVGLPVPVICPAFVIPTAGVGRGATAQAAASATITLPASITIPAGTANGLTSSAASVTVNINGYAASALTPDYYDNFTALADQLAPIELSQSHTYLHAGIHINYGSLQID